MTLRINFMTFNATCGSSGFVFQKLGNGSTHNYRETSLRTRVELVR